MLPPQNILMLLSIATALVLGLRIRKPRGAFYNGLLGLLALAFAVELWGGITNSRGIPNVIVYNLYTTAEFVVFMGLARLFRPAWRPWLLAVGVAGVSAMLWSAMVTGPTRHLAVEGLLVLGVLSSGVFLCLLVDLARTATMPLWQVPAFVLFTGTLLYFGGTIPVLGAWRSMTALDRDVSMAMYRIVVALALVRYLLTAVACWMEHRNRTRTWTLPS